jgi:hypothetical protein
MRTVSMSLYDLHRCSLMLFCVLCAGGLTQSEFVARVEGLHKKCGEEEEEVTLLFEVKGTGSRTAVGTEVKLEPEDNISEETPAKRQRNDKRVNGLSPTEANSTDSSDSRIRMPPNNQCPDQSDEEVDTADGNSSEEESSSEPPAVPLRSSGRIVVSKKFW